MVQSNGNFSIPLERKHHSEMWKQNLPVTQISALWSLQRPVIPLLPFFFGFNFPKICNIRKCLAQWTKPSNSTHRETIALTPCLNSSAHTTRCTINRDQASSDAGSMFPEDPAVSSSSPKEQNFAVQFRTEILCAVSRAN